MPPARRQLAWIVPLFAAIVVVTGGCGPSDTGIATGEGGGSALNIPLDRPARMVALRWVPDRDGSVEQLYLRVKVEGSDECPLARRRGYADGTTGRLRATTHPVRPDGTPDPANVLASDEFNPCQRQEGESIAIRLGTPVRVGVPLVTVVRNVDEDPSANWFSLNFLLDSSPHGEGKLPSRPFPGRDPRETIQMSEDDGATWAPDATVLPTYIVEYGEGRRSGQPYYYSRTVSTVLTMVFPHARRLVIGGIGAWTSEPGSGLVTLAVDGKDRVSATLRGVGALQVAIPPVDVPEGSTVTLTTRAGSGGLGLRVLYADAVWARLMRLGRNAPRYLHQGPREAVALYPIVADPRRP